MKHLALSILLLLPLCGWAQTDDEDEFENTPANFEHEIGFHAGMSTGIGPSYRHWFDRFGIQVTAMPIKTSSWFYMNGGLTAMYSIQNYRKVRIFGYWGNCVIHEHYASNYYINNNSHTKYNTGVGFGFSLGHIVALNLQAGYGAFDLFGGYDRLTLSLTGEVGLYYRF